MTGHESGMNFTQYITQSAANDTEHISDLASYIITVFVMNVVYVIALAVMYCKL